MNDLHKTVLENQSLTKKIELIEQKNEKLRKALRDLEFKFEKEIRMKEQYLIDLKEKDNHIVELVRNYNHNWSLINETNSIYIDTIIYVY